MSAGATAAFPITERQWQQDHPDFHGLSKREYFAALAMQGQLSFSHPDAELLSPQGIAELAVKHADALIAALEVGS